MTDKVTQAARDAAADLHAIDLGEPLSEADWFYLNEIRTGRNDEDDGVQAFARFEAETIARTNTELVEAASRALQILERNLHRQTEKCDDAITILRKALSLYAKDGDER